MGKKNKSAIDKIIMGAIVGAAIGSVIGSAVAPDKGEKTRKKLRNKAEEIASMVKKRNHQVLSNIYEERKHRSVMRKVWDVFFGSKKKDIKRIPTEDYEHEEV